MTARKPQTDQSAIGASERTRLYLAAMVALSAMLGALTAWQAGKTSIRADEADRAGFRQKIAEVELRARVRRGREASLYSYLDWTSHITYAAALARGAQAVDAADAARLRLEAGAERAVAAQAWDAIPDAALTGEAGKIDLDPADRALSAELRNEERIDATPEEEFAEADRLRAKREWLVLCAAFMLVAAVAFTLAQVRRQRDWRAWVGVGFTLLPIATVAAVVAVLT